MKPSEYEHNPPIRQQVRTYVNLVVPTDRRGMNAQGQHSFDSAMQTLFVALADAELVGLLIVGSVFVHCNAGSLDTPELISSFHYTGLPELLGINYEETNGIVIPTAQSSLFPQDYVASSLDQTPPDHLLSWLRGS